MTIFLEFKVMINVLSIIKKNLQMIIQIYIFIF